MRVGGCSGWSESSLGAKVILLVLSWLFDARKTVYECCWFNNVTFCWIAPHDVAPCKQYLNHRMTKPTKWHVGPAKTQISPGICPVRSESSLSTWRKAWVLSYPLSTKRRLWLDWADAQADLSLRWAHMPFCWFCHEAAHFPFYIWEQIPKYEKKLLILPLHRIIEISSSCTIKLCFGY